MFVNQRRKCRGNTPALGVFFLGLFLVIPALGFAKESLNLEYVQEHIVFTDVTQAKHKQFTFLPETDLGATTLSGTKIYWLKARERQGDPSKVVVQKGQISPTVESKTTPAPPGFESLIREQGNQSKQFLTQTPDVPQNVGESPQESPVDQPEPEVTPEPTPEPTPKPDPEPPVIFPLPPDPPQVNHEPTVENVTFDTSEDSELRETLTGTDPDNNQLTFSQGNANPLHGTLTINPNGTFQYAPEADYFGFDSFNYQATDGSLNSNLGTVTLNILSVNDLPQAKAGSDQTVASGSIVTLDGSNSSDIEGSDLIYAWTQSDGPEVTLDNPESPTPTFTAPTGPLTLIFNLQVQDSNNGVSQTDSVIITVEAPQSQGTTYYIDQYHPSANDSNTGTSEDQPWKTINSDLINALSPGDTVLIKGDASRVGLYTEPRNLAACMPYSIGCNTGPLVSISNLHGELGAEITIKNYPGHKVTLDGQDQPGSRHGDVFRIDDSSYIRIEGLRLIHPMYIALRMFNSSYCTIQD
ncbi:MAG: cadherin-like domain-containing protein, partial [Candidatus Omnitrophica bacterium]|nr:cadherin-like domain-containing protein [Candidatus Omnitrophota bacterium]